MELGTTFTKVHLALRNPVNLLALDKAGIGEYSRGLLLGQSKGKENAMPVLLVLLWQ